MTEQEHYSLRWNNHQNHILRAFDALLQTKSLVDVTLVCAETSICAHKVVLSACSPFFQHVFAENPCKHPVIVLKDFPGWVVKAVVDFMYRGEISVPQKRLETLIQVGESLQIRGLVEHRKETKGSYSLQSNDDDYLDRSVLSIDSIANYDDASTLINSTNSNSHLTNGKNLLLSTNLLTDATIDSATITSSTSSSPSIQKPIQTISTTPTKLSSKTLLSTTTTTTITTTSSSSSPSKPTTPSSTLTATATATATTTTTSTISQQQQQHQNHHHHHHQYDNRELLCTSPMPRRKQARPRRRSGECGPHDYSSSKPTTPLPIVQKLTQSSNANDLQNERIDNDNEQRKVTVKRSETDNMILDATDKVVDCTLATMEQSLIRKKIQLNEEDDLTDNELYDDDEEENDMNVHRMHDNIDQDDDLDDDENDEKLSLSDRKLRNRVAAQFLCDNVSGLSVPEQYDDTNDADGPENLCIKSSRSLKNDEIGNNNNNKDKNNSNNNSITNNNRISLALKDIRHLNRPPSHCRQNLFSGFSVHHQQHNQQQDDEHTNSRDQLQKLDQTRQNQMQQNTHNNQVFLESAENLKRETLESRLDNDNSYIDQIDLSLAAAAAAAAHHQSANLHHSSSRHHEMDNLHKDFTPSSPMSLQSHFNPREAPPHPPSPLQFPGMSSALTLTPPHHMFGLDTPLSLFPPGMDPGKLYNPLMEMSDPRSMHPHSHGPYLKKKNKLSRPKGQHSAPRGGPPRSWTNAELTEALHHVWNKKMTTSQASRLFGIPYNSLLMYVRGKYGKSLNLEQLRKGCISGPPIELLTMGLGTHTNNNSSSSKNSLNSTRSKDIKELDENHGGRASGSNSMKRSTSSEPDLLPNPIFNPFSAGFYPDFGAGFPIPLNMLNLLPPERHVPSMHTMQIDEDCKSDRSKQSLEDDYPMSQPLALNRDDHREIIQQNGQD